MATTDTTPTNIRTGTRRAAAMADDQRPNGTPTEAERSAWLEELHREITRRARAAHGPARADDIASNEVVRAAEKLDRLMAKWTPARYARQRINRGRALLDWQRTDRVQRGEGARGTRKVKHLDAPTRKAKREGGSTTLLDILADDREDSLDCAADRLFAQGLVRPLLAVLTDAERTLVDLIHGDGLTVLEAAEKVGVVRETASRAYNRALRKLLAAYAEQFDGEIEPPC